MNENLENSCNLNQKLELPCGATLKNRLVKSPMSDSLGDGEGNPSKTQIRLYERWAENDVALSIIGEVQIESGFPEKPGNLVFAHNVDKEKLKELTKRAVINDAHLWTQLGHAGALSHTPISNPKGPSPLDIDGLKCEGMSIDEIKKLPSLYANAAMLAKEVGFTGVMIHGGHGFLLSQFLSPLFNHREDEYGDSIKGRSRVILDIIEAIRNSVGTSYPIGIRINSSDMLEGGLIEEDALEVIRFLDKTSIDIIGISGGTYFPGAKSSSESSSGGPYFTEFAKRAKLLTDIPLILTGGFKNRNQVVEVLSSGSTDMVGIGRAMILEPKLASIWLSDKGGDPVFPRFDNVISGGLTAWYSMRQIAIGEDKEEAFNLDLTSAVKAYEDRNFNMCDKWNNMFNRKQYL